MSRAAWWLAGAVIAGGLLLQGPAWAQELGIPGRNSTSLSDLDTIGPNTVQNKGKADAEIIKEARRKYADADPRVRVDGLEKLRFVKSSDANELLFRGIADSDIRVRIKAIDVLGARGVSDAVAIMNQDLFLRETPAIEKLHLVAALGRIGDQRGTLPIVEYLKQTDDPASRGTAVFALGEIGDPRADSELIQIVTNEQSPKVRRLAQEALEKIDGELPSEHQAQLAQAKASENITTDERLSKLRDMDAKMQAQQY